MACGAAFVLTAVILGAFGAHALKELLSNNQLASFEIGVRYQMYHGFALLFTGIFLIKFRNSSYKQAIYNWNTLVFPFDLPIKYTRFNRYFNFFFRSHHTYWRSPIDWWMV